MWDYRYLSRIDFRMIPVTLALMLISLLVISSTTGGYDGGESFFTPFVKSQIQWFFLGSLSYLFFAGFDYHKLREWTWILYALMLIGLLGLFLTDPLARVHRWYRLPLIHVHFQPAEYAKLVVVMALSWLLEKRKRESETLSTLFFAGIIVGIPFLLILKQPDLGTAMVLFPISLAIFYFGDLHPFFLKLLSVTSLCVLTVILLIFLNVIPFEKIEPLAQKFLKSYQVERLNPHSHHQSSSVTAIAIGGITGKGWHKSGYTSRGWLPASHTDSVFSAFSEEFGLLGNMVMMALFYTLIYFGFQVTAIAKDSFGRLLSAGITIYLAMHIVVNVGMMSGLLPISGVPLVLISYGGSSVIATMTALGVLQSIYSRRFMF